MFTVPTKNKTVGNLSEKVGLLGKGDRLYKNVECWEKKESEGIRFHNLGKNKIPNFHPSGSE